MSTPTQPANGELRLTPQNPWPGLAAFTAANREFFYGREAEIAEIFRRVRRQMLTVLFGVSGLGKTSLLQAGLLPKLGGTPFHPILIRLDHSPAAPDLITQVRAAITREVEAANQLGVKVPRGPTPDEDLWGYFHDKTTDWLNAKGDIVNPVLVFDQFEEIFTREASTRELEERRQRFMELLANLVENRPPDALARGLDTDAEFAARYDFRQEDYRVVISLREDFLAHLESFKQRMPSVMENRMRLKPMTEEQALQAVLGPGREIVEEPVGREIVAFVAGKARGTQPTSAGPSAALESTAPAEADPVLLSLVCDQLNRRRRERNQERITADLLTEEREGIIQEFYDQAFKGLEPKVREWVEDELLTASGYRNRAAQEDALQAGIPSAALDELVSGRILHREERGGVVWLELTHDLLTGPATASRKAREQRLQEEAAARREQALKQERDAQRRQARRSAWIARSLAATLVGLLALAWWYWDGYLRTHTEYYVTFAKRRGFFEGVGRLTEAQAAHRRVSYRFITKGRHGQLIRVQAMDARGRLTPKHGAGTYLRYASEDENPERECQWEFIRDARGRVVYEMALNRDTNLVWGFVYSPATTNEFSRRGHFVSPTGMPLAMRNSSAEYIEFTYDANGFEAKLTYQDHQGDPQSGPDGQYGEVRTHDARGLVIKKTSLNSAGKPMVDNAGNSTLDIEYDALGLETRLWASVLTNWNRPARPVLLKSGYHEARFAYDAHGNRVEQTFFDVAGKPVLLKDGYARVTEKYDERGNPVEWACFDVAGKPTLDRANYKHRVEMAYDERGNLTNWVMCDTQGRRSIATDGFGQIAFRFNERGQEAERTYYDSAGKQVRLSAGYARVTRGFDERGRVTEESYFDEAGRPRGGAGRYARKRLSYDERGNLASEAFFDAAGQPMAGANQYARMTAKHDERGNRIEEAYFDELGLPVLHKNGYARVTKRYDTRGNLIEESNFDENDSPVRLEEGYCRRTMRYDERNNKIEEAYFNEQGQPVRQKEGVARKVFLYDERGNNVEEAYRDETEKPINSNGGYARLLTNYDENDNWIEGQFITVNGLPLAPENGYATVRARYNALRQQIELSYFDDKGQPLQRKGGYSRLTKSYDERGNQTEQFHFDAQGKPVREVESKAHGWRRSFDARGNWTNWVYLDGVGQPILSAYQHASAAAVYDERGNQIEKRWFDGAGNLLPQSEGYAKLTWLYDAQDNKVEEAYFDATNRPTQVASGYVKKTWQYNDHGNRTETAFWDEDGKAVAGVARWISRYDLRGNETEFGYFDAGTNAVIGPANGWHKWVKTFDSFGRWTNLSYLDVEGGLTDSKQGFAREARGYNPRGKLVELAWFNATDQRVNGTNGYARMLAKYDDQGNQVERAYFKPNERPGRGPEGYTRYSARFDRQGRRLDAAYYYEPGNPTRVQNGYAQVTIRYDERGNQIQWACFDEAGQPVPDQSDGVHLLQTTYDEFGRWISKTYLGTSGQLQMRTNGYARLEVKYDPAGNMVEKLYFDERNEPVRTEEFYFREVITYDERGRKTESHCYWSPESSVWLEHSYALTKRTFDEKGNLLSWACFDTNGAPVVDLTMGNHASRRQYDARGNYTNLVYLDVAGQPVVTSNGYARLEIRRDALGKELESLYFDEKGGPMNSGTSAWRETTTYDERGRKTEASFYYASSSPVWLVRGIAQSTLNYDAKGNNIRWACFDTNGQPAIDRSLGHHAWTKAYDARGNVTNQLYLGVHQRPTRIKSGYAEIRALYDRRNLVLTRSYFGPEGAPALDLTDGTHQTRWSYDANGSWTNIAYFGLNRAPIINSNGYARVTAAYDVRKNQIEWACFDAAGRPTLNSDGYARIAREYNALNQLTEINFYDAQGKRLVRRQAISTVTPDGQGARVGLQPGDVILSYGGEEVSLLSELQRLVHAPGTEARELKVRRAGRILSFKVQPGLLGLTLDLKFEALTEPGNSL